MGLSVHWAIGLLRLFIFGGINITLFALRNPSKMSYYLMPIWWGSSSTFERHHPQLSTMARTFYSIQICILLLSKGKAVILLQQGLKQFSINLVWLGKGVGVENCSLCNVILIKTRPYTRQNQSHANGQEQWCENCPKNAEKTNALPTDQPTDQPTQWVIGRVARDKNQTSRSVQNISSKLNYHF